MKKKLLIGFATLALGLVAAFNISLNAGKSNLSMLSLANIEALAQSEIEPTGYFVYHIGCMDQYGNFNYTWSASCTPGYGTNSAHSHGCSSCSSV